MRWVIDKEEQESCPYLGGVQFTAGDRQVITEIKIKKNNPKSGEPEEVWVEPAKFLK
jgi:hypothetical protein